MSDVLDGARTKLTTDPRSGDHAVEVFLTFFGPTIRMSEALDDATKRELIHDLRRVFEKHDRAVTGEKADDSTSGVRHFRFRWTRAPARYSGSDLS